MHYGHLAALVVIGKTATDSLKPTQKIFLRNADAKLIKIFAFYKKVVSLPSKIKSAIVLHRTANSE